MASKLLSEEAVRQALRAKFSPPAWAFLPQVRNGTGYARRTVRTADALAMSLYPSRGLELHGFEIKTDRGDWKRELDNPEKAEEIASYSDRWWVVIGDAEIVRPGELPPTWGLMVPNGKGLRVVVEAPVLTPKPLDRLLLAAILRKANEVNATEGEIAQAVSAAVEAERKSSSDTMERATRGLRDANQLLQKKINDFERESGISMEQWSFRPRKFSVGAAVRYVLDGGFEAEAAKLAQLRGQAASILAGIDTIMKAAQPAHAAQGDDDE